MADQRNWCRTGGPPLPGAIYHAITRMDGAKMFLLGAMALAISQLARHSPILPRWLAPLGARWPQPW